MFTLIVLGTIFVAGGGTYAAFDGLLGKRAQAEADKVKASVEAELKKVENSAVAEVKKLVADVRAKL